MAARIPARSSLSASSRGRRGPWPPQVGEEIEEVELSDLSPVRGCGRRFSVALLAHE